MFNAANYGTVACLLLVLLSSLWATLANPVFVRVDTRQLPEQAAMTLAQDRSGFIWVGTQGGLARFDGYRYRNFLPDPSNPQALPDGYVRTLLPDADGLWIGSSTDGLARFDSRSEQFRTWRPDPLDRTGPRSGEVVALLRSPDGSLWVGGDGGLDRYIPKTGRFVRAPWPAGEPPVVWCLLRDRSSTIWAGTQDGLYALAPGAAQFRKVKLVGASPVFSVFEDGAARLWAGSVSKVWEIDEGRRHARAFSSVPADARTLAPGQQWSLFEPRAGVVWAGSDNAISEIQTKTDTVRRIEADANDPSGLTSGRVMQFLRDRSGLIWIADHVGGLLLYNPSSRGLDNLSSSRPEIGPSANGGTLTVAVTRSGDLWAGGLGGKLVELDPRLGRIAAMTMPTAAAIQALLVERSGDLWIGTTNGLCRLAAGTSRPQCPAGPRIPTESIYKLYEDGSRLWIGGSNGLYAVSRTSVTHYAHGTEPRELRNDQVRVLLRDRSGRMWIGTENGLDVLGRDGTIANVTFNPHGPNSIGPGAVTTLAQDGDGRIWAGAEGGPLNVITERAGAAPLIRHLGVDDADGIAEDARGRMWVSTDKGIAIVDERSLNIRTLGLADGVSEAGFWAGSVAQAPDGTIFFGGLDGTTVVEPDAVSPWAYRPPIVVTALQAGRRIIAPGAVNLDASGVTLTPQSRNLALEFAALDYSAPQVLRYQYRLRGYDREWVDADPTQRVATYTHLPPGDYTLDVRATNRLGLWSATPLRVTVLAVPAWYETWWFRALALVAGMFALYALIRLRTEVLLRRQHELEAVVEHRTFELSQANEKLQEISVNDPLTGLRNRRFVNEHLDAESAITLRRYNAWLADPASPPPFDADILFYLIDLDNFKAINDGYGHIAGDALLTGMSALLQDVFRGSDFVARWGGDEFLAIARGSRREEAGEIAERLRAAVAAHEFCIDGQAMNVRVSIGFAAFPFVREAPHAFSWPQVVAFADQALYLAKNAGRNTWRGIVAPDEHAASEGTMQIVSPAHHTVVERTEA